MRRLHAVAISRFLIASPETTREKVTVEYEYKVIDVADGAISSLLLHGRQYVLEMLVGRTFSN